MGRLQPQALELRYRRMLDLWLQHVASLASDLVESAVARHMDAAYSSEAFAARAALERMGSVLREAGPLAIRDQLASLARDANSFELQRMSEVLGIDVSRIVPDADLTAFIDDNVELIKSLTDDFFSDVATAVEESVREGDHREGLQQRLQERFAVSSSRAELIARDQLGKLNGQLNAVRQQDLGIESYVWRTMRDSRVREEHRRRDGKRFRWDSPPNGGNPGEAIQCRCYAEPVLPEVLQ